MSSLPSQSPSSSSSSNTTTSNDTYQFPAEWAYSAYEGVSMITVYDRRLERIDISGITLPFYRHRSCYKLIALQGYVEFANDLQVANPGRPLDRPTTEACWMKILTPLYQAWDPRGMAAKGKDGLYVEAPFRLKMRVLEYGKQQINDENAQRYWQNKVQKYGSLDLRCCFDPMTPEESIEYDLWLTTLDQEPLLPGQELTKLDRMLLGELPWDDEEEKEEVVEPLETIAEEDRMEE